MAQNLVLTIRLHDRRYHGTAEWPPAPARAFQALVAAAARGATVPEDAAKSLTWLEELGPPLIVAPRSRRGQALDVFVPNNDLDSVGGDLERVGEIRCKKSTAPRLLASDDPFLYVWRVDEEPDALSALQTTALRLYQFGRGWDLAWAALETVSDAALEAMLREHRGTRHTPSERAGRCSLACPAQGSLASLRARFAAPRFERGADGKVVYRQPPKPRFLSVSYDGSPAVEVFALQRAVGKGGRPARDDELYGWSLTRAVALVETLRDGAAERLRAALPARADAVDRHLIGRRTEHDLSTPVERVRIIPLPSIGHEHADLALRRVMVQVPSGIGLSPDEVFWAFSGLAPADPTSGEIRFVLARTAPNDRMPRRYLAPSRRFRTVTPAALPETAARRRIDPARVREEAKSARERLAEEASAISAIGTALRHAAVCARVVAVRVQREPFDRRGKRAEQFARETRFAKERLWHVELELGEAIDGPLVLGDGRFLGLGLLCPVESDRTVHAFTIESGLMDPDPVLAARALRRAVMARVQALNPRAPLPPYVSGHEIDGSAVRGEQTPHLAFHFDPIAQELLLVPPHLLADREAREEERRWLATLERALEGMSELRAGRVGLLTLRHRPIDVDHDPRFAVARAWTTLTPYRVTRHPKRMASAVEAIAYDLRAECLRQGLPPPEVRNIEEVRALSGIGLEARVRLTFTKAVRGPLALGRSRYLGGGLFVPVDCEEARR